MAQTDTTPQVYANENEAHILGIIGVVFAGLSISCLLALIGKFIAFSQDVVFVGALLSAFCCACVLCLIQQLNDFFINGKGHLVLIVVSVVGQVICLLLYPLSSAWLIVGICASCLALVAWGNYFVCLEHTPLNLVLLIHFLSIGIGFLFVYNIETTEVTLALYLCFAGLSYIFCVILHPYLSSVPVLIKRDESRRNIRSEQNKIPNLFITGLMLSITTLCLINSCAGHPFSYVAIGIAIIISATITGLARRKPDRAFEYRMNRHLVIDYLIGFFVYLLAPGMFSLVGIFFCFCVAFSHVYDVSSAIIENVTSCSISPYFEFGMEGMWVALGCTTPPLICLILSAFDLNAVGSSPLTLCVYLSLIVLAIAHVNIIQGRYPHASSAKSSVNTRMQNAEAIKERVEQIAYAYKLSPRQKEVLLLLARGRNTAYISEALCVSKATAKSHIHSTYQKLNIHSQQELIDMIDADSNTSKGALSG